MSTTQAVSKQLSGIADAARPVASSAMGKIQRVFFGIAGALTTYNLLDSGLARFFALETLTHGTNPLGYLGIMRNGAHPSMGGSSLGSSAGAGDMVYRVTSVGYFHVFKDSEFAGFNNWGLLGAIMRVIHKFFLLRTHSTLSTNALLKNTTKIQLFASILAHIIGLFIPALKFRFRPDELRTGRFENDPYHEGRAYRTSQPISPYRLGITGTVTRGIDSNMGKRMGSNITKVLTGVVLLFGALFTTRATYNQLKSAE
jgi:hypothetical protein